LENTGYWLYGQSIGNSVVLTGYRPTLFDEKVSSFRNLVPARKCCRLKGRRKAVARSKQNVLAFSLIFVGAQLMSILTRYDKLKPSRRFGANALKLNGSLKVKDGVAAAGLGTTHWNLVCWYTATAGRVDCPG
jgi:hypothetical protein